MLLAEAEPGVAENLIGGPSVGAWTRMFKDPDVPGGFVSVTYAEIFAGRPEAFWILNLLEFAAFCKLVPRKAENLDELNEECDDGDGKTLKEWYDMFNAKVLLKRRGVDDKLPDVHLNGGRNDNASWRFEGEHPLFSTQVVSLGTVQRTVILGGTKPPDFPGEYPMTSVGDLLKEQSDWLRKANTYAYYMLLLLRPWHVENGTTDIWPLPSDPRYSWAEFRNWLTDPSHNSSFIGQSRFRVLENISQGFFAKSDTPTISDSARLSLLTRWRFQNADRWRDKPGSYEQYRAGRRGRSNFEGDDKRLREKLNVNSSLTGVDRDALQFKAFMAGVESNYDSAFAAMSEPTEDEFAERRPRLQASNDPTEALSVRFASSAALALDVSIRTDAGVSVTEVCPPPETEATPRSGDAGRDLPESEPPVDSAQFPRLCEKQLQVVKLFQLYFKACQRGDKDAVPPFVFLTGGPGTGKTETIKAIMRIAADYGVTVIFSAFTGSASSNVAGGVTLNSLFDFEITVGNTKNARVHTMQSDKRTVYTDTLKGSQCKLLIVDEISMLSPMFLGAIEQRLQELHQADLRNGGIALLLGGDFAQLESNKDTIYRGCMQLERINTKFAQLMQLNVDALTDEEFEEAVTLTSFPLTDARSISGASLFSNVTIIELVKQHRCAKDPDQTIRISYLRNTKKYFPVTKEITDSFLYLSADDVESDPTWAFAPLATMQNDVRVKLSIRIAQQFAKYYNQPVFRWRLDIPDLEETYPGITLDQLNDLYEAEPCLWGYFIKDAPSFMLDNMNAVKGYANGSPCLMHSLTFSDNLTRNDRNAINVLLDRKDYVAGSFVDLPFIPEYINVMMTSEHFARNFAKSDTLFVNGVRTVKDKLPPVTGSIVPISMYGKNHRHFDVKNVKVGAFSVFPKRKFKLRTHAVEFGFGVTFHKLQGRTVPKLTFLLYTYNRFFDGMVFKQFYVGYSRCSCNDDLRFIVSGGELERRTAEALLWKMTNDVHYLIWLGGFAYNDRTKAHYGVWSRKRCLANMRVLIKDWQLELRQSGMCTPELLKTIGTVTSRTKINWQLKVKAKASKTSNRNPAIHNSVTVRMPGGRSTTTKQPDASTALITFNSAAVTVPDDERTQLPAYGIVLLFLRDVAGFPRTPLTVHVHKRLTGWDAAIVLALGLIDNLAPPEKAILYAPFLSFEQQVRFIEDVDDPSRVHSRVQSLPLGSIPLETNGIHNSFNDCFISVCMQALFAYKPFVDLVESYVSLEERNVPGHSFVKELHLVFGALAQVNGPQISVRPLMSEFNQYR